MEQIKKYVPLIVIVILAVVATLVGGWKATQSEFLLDSDTWGFPFWLTPLGYLALAWLFGGGHERLNQPVVAFGAFLVYLLSVVLLFLPLPPGMQWHYVIGIGTIVYVFTGW